MEKPKELYKTIQDVFVYFLNKLQEAHEFLEPPIVVSSVIDDELSSKQHFLVTSEKDKLKNFNNPTYWLPRDFARIIFFQHTFFWQLTVLDTVSIPQIKFFSLFLRMFFRFNYQLMWNTIDRNFFKNL